MTTDKARKYRLAKEASGRGVYLTGCAWSRWVEEQAERIEQLERRLDECGQALTDERSHNRDLVAHANAMWQCVLSREARP